MNQGTPYELVEPRDRTHEAVERRKTLVRERGKIEKSETLESLGKRRQNARRRRRRSSHKSEEGCCAAM